MATGFDYVWVGPGPAWLWLTLALCPVLAHKRFGAWALRVFTRKLWSNILLPWCALLGAILVSDAYHGTIESSLSSIVLYSLLTMVAMLVSASLSSLIDPKRLTMALAVIAALQGCVAIGQYLGVHTFWLIPDRLLSQAARGDQSLQLGAVEDLQLAGRVRGTHMFVHKFAASQGIMVAYLLVTLAGSRQLGTSLRGRAVLLGLVVIAFVGALLTFSRSCVIGSAFAIVGAVGLASRRRQLLKGSDLLAFACAAVVILLAIDVTGSRQVGRLLDFDVGSSENEARFDVARLGLAEFARSPVIGVGSEVDTRAVGIPIHSVLIRMLASYGVLGGIFYCFTVFGILRALWKAQRANVGARHVTALAGFCGFVVGLIDASTHTSGFPYRDVAQPVLTGAFLSQIEYAGPLNRLLWQRRRG